MSTPHIQISIDGTPLPTFKSFDLRQAMYEHHSFSLVLGHAVIEDLGSHTLENSKAWVGKVLAAEFGDNEFVGIITSIRMVHFHGLNGDLEIRGHSPTILLEAGPHLQSWNEKSLDDIAQEVVDAAGIEATIGAVHTSPVVYMAQYRESHFAFLQRLATTYHEWFFYDGRMTYFGKPEPGEAIPVFYGKDLESIEISMQIAPLKGIGYSYHALNDENFSAPSPGSVPGLNDMGQEAMAASLEHFGIEPQQSVAPRVDDQGRLEEVMANRQAAAAANLTMISGLGKKMELKPGAIIDLQAKVRESRVWEDKPYGNFLVVSVHHHLTGNYQYSNSFEAIPADVEILPEPAVRWPVAEPQLATVLSNADPESKGRVEVQFLWQSGAMKSPWVRVMTPDAGGSGEVPSNRGLVVVPEEGDQVMVGFRYNDPLRPFVMGSMFSGTTGGGGGDGNKSKSLTTRSGCTVILDDGAGSITIKDPSDNVITLNGDGTMSITAPNELTISSEKINILAGTEIYVEGGTQAKVSSPEILVEAETTLDMSSGANLLVSSAVKEETHGKIDIKSDSTVDINGTAMTNIKGGMVNLN